MSESALNVLVIGSGGREHALARALAADPKVVAVHVAPGNPGTARFATNHPVEITDGNAVVSLARSLKVDLVVIGPEVPLVAGVADTLTQAGILVFGPSQQAARLEGSKAFAKQIMADAGVPTAEARICETPQQAAAAVDEFGPPYVVKDDGLAAGKGVVVTDDRAVALAHAASCERVVIEEYLDGPEVSVFAITDGTQVRVLQPAQDFKRVGEGNRGPNTGGMGAYTPLPWAPPGLADDVVSTIVEPVLAQMRSRGTPFVGLLYVGLALTSRGMKVVEFNARFGDPETEAILPLLATPLGGLLYAAANGRLADVPALTWLPEACVCVVVAARGYPGDPIKGGLLTLPEDTERVHIIHAGTAEHEGRLVSAGGRVVVVVSRGDDLESARVGAYEMIDRIDFPDGFCRTDIAAVELMPE